MIVVGKCEVELEKMDANSVDAVVTDPPYELNFMGREWDRQGVAFDPETWRKAYRVVKPGGHLLAFGGSRTHHRIAAAIEDAGFEIRDTIRQLNGAPGEQLLWLYGSGFPKSLDVSKAIDAAAGAERTEVVGVKPGHEDFVERTDAHAAGGRSDGWDRPWRDDPEAIARSHMRLAPATPEAAEWEGWGTALKPAHEPIIVARKPLSGTVAATVLEHGTGALNIDGCRIGFVSKDDERESKDKNRHGDFGTEHGGNEVYGDYSMLGTRDNYDPEGRWPANVVLVHAEGCVKVGARAVESNGHFPAARPASTADGGPVGHVGQEGLDEWHTKGELVETWECADGCPVAAVDAQSGRAEPKERREGRRGGNGFGFFDDDKSANGEGVWPADPGGGASRFFYTAKASRAERNAGLDAFEKKPILWSSGEQNPGSFQAEGTEKAARNHHPTVKPVALMRWLVRLVTRPGGRVLDPFAGSGTTGIACALEGMEFVGIEQDAEYAAIAEARIAFWQEHGEDALRIVAEREAGQRVRQAVADAGQLDLFG